MDLKNTSLDLENKGFSYGVKSFLPNNFEDNLNMENLENDFIIPNNFNILNNNNNFKNEFDNLDNLVIDFNTNVHFHTDNINSIDNIDKSKINKKLNEKEKRKLLNDKDYKNIDNDSQGKEIENQNYSRKKKKIDLNKTPLPIFACIYCSNENVVFKHMSNEIISGKYLYNCSPQDLKNINIIVSTYFVYNLTASLNTQIKGIVNLILNYSEYISNMHLLKNSKELIKNYANKQQENKENHDNSTYKPMLKYRFFCTENTMMTFLFKNTSNYN